LKIITIEEDAFGQEIWAHHNGQNSFEVIERDDGYFDVSSGAKLYFSSHDDWAANIQKAMEHVKGRVLDVGCGAGRHSLYLQEKGFDVLGIDVSPLAIKVCRLRGLKKAKVMSIDQVKFKPNSFDTIIMMGNNFGLFGSLEKARRLLKRFHKMTSQDALIIAETRDPYRTDNPDHLEYQEFNRNKGRMSGQLRLRVRFKKYASPWFDYLIVSKEEMKKILDGTGWNVNGFLDDGNSVYVALMEKR
jgi:SAM-dependent methyltransferase